VSGPRVLQAGSGRVGVSEEAAGMCGEKKINRCRAPECSEPEVAGSGHWTEQLCFFGKKRRNCSIFQVLVRVLPSESFSLLVPGRMTSMMF
jgi:hypothetical protein